MSNKSIKASTSVTAPAPTSGTAALHARSVPCAKAGCIEQGGAHLLEPGETIVIHRAFDATRSDWYAEVYKCDLRPDEGWVVEAQLTTSGPIPLDVAREFTATLTGCYALASELNGAA